MKSLQTTTKLMMGIALLFLISCSKNLETERAMVQLLQASEQTGDVTNVLINNEGKVIVQTIENWDRNLDSFNYLSNKFILYDDGFQMLKNFELKNCLLYPPTHEGNFYYFPSNKCVGSNKWQFGVTVVEENLNQAPEFFSCDSAVKNPGESFNLFPGSRIFLSRFENGDWCFAFTDYTGIAKTYYVNLGSDITKPKRNWRTRGYDQYVVCGVPALPKGILSLESGSGGVVSSVLSADGTFDKYSNIGTNAFVYATQCKSFWNEAGELMVYTAGGDGYMLTFGNNGVFKQKRSLGFAYYNIDEYTNMLPASQNGFISVRDSVSKSHYNTEISFFDASLQRYRTDLYPSVNPYSLNSYSNYLIHHALLKNPKGGYLLFQFRQTKMTNRYNWVFIRLDDNLKPPA